MSMRGGSFIEGLQQINVREVGLVTNVHDIEQTVIKTKNGTPLRVQDIATVAQGPKIRLGRIGKSDPSRRRQTRGQRRRGRRHRAAAQGRGIGCDARAIHAKVKELNEHILPPGVKVVPFSIAATWCTTPRTPCCTT